jgi:hypothetical protein
MLAGYVLMMFFFGLIIWFMCRKNKDLGRFSEAMLWAFAKSMLAVLAAGVAAGLLVMGVVSVVHSVSPEQGALLFDGLNMKDAIGDVASYIGSTLVSLYLVFVALHYKKK